MRTQADRKAKSKDRVQAWHTNVLDAVANRQDGHDRTKQTIFQVRIWWPFIRHLDAAALVKGVNRSTYIRRALAVAMAYDLDMDVRDLLQHTIHPDASRFRDPKRPRQRGKSAFAPTRDDGVGIEKWCPHPGCDGTHICAAITAKRPTGKIERLDAVDDPVP